MRLKTEKTVLLQQIENQLLGPKVFSLLFHWALVHHTCLPCYRFGVVLRTDFTRASMAVLLCFETCQGVVSL